MNEVLKKVFERLKKNKATTLIPPATAGLISATNEDLAAGGHTAIPDEYAQFLMITNGVRSPAFTLFGTEPMEMTPDIYAATETGTERNYINNGLVLGDAFGNLALAYSADGKNYRLVDKSCGDVLYEFKTLSDFIISWLDRSKL